MQLFSFILLVDALIVCNLIYCGQHIIADLRSSKRAQVALGVAAFSGALLAMLAMTWATLASLYNT